MKMTFRWYGKNDPVTLEKIAQIPGMTGVVSAIYDIPVGEVWPLHTIIELKNTINSYGLELEVIESVPVHEDIKLGLPTREKYIENYIQNIINLSLAGIKVICFNFMPVFDWTRSKLDYKLPDHSTTLVYFQDEINKMNPLTGELNLPGWDTSYTKESLSDLFNQYKSVSEEKLWENLEYFIQSIIPTAENHDVLMAIHPDDPPWGIFGLPRLITNEQNIDRYLNIVDSKHHGLTFCTGSLGVSKTNDVVHMIDKYAKLGRIHFMHIRNIKHINESDFLETSHKSSHGDIDVVKVLKALHNHDFKGYVRPDHGRMIWGETGKPGYGLYDRALGSTYINGIWETLETLKNMNGDLK